MIAWWQSLPAPVRAAIVNTWPTFILTSQTVLVTIVVCASNANALGTPQSTFAYIEKNWWSIFIAIVLPLAFRSRQGYVNGQKIQTLQEQKGP
jgi:hypothetical protein